MLFICFYNVTAYDVANFAVRWEKDGTILYVDMIQYAPKDPRIIFRSSDSSLVVTNVSASDSGHYYCIYSSRPPVQVKHQINVFGKRSKARFALCACILLVEVGIVTRHWTGRSGFCFFGLVQTFTFL
jgi:hypothetical protein